MSDAAEPAPPRRPTVRIDGAAVAVAAAPTTANGAAKDDVPAETDTDYLSGLVAAAVDKTKRISIIEVVRPVEGADPDDEGRVPERVLFRFGVRMLDDREDDAAREKHTANRGNDVAGRAIEETDWIKYRCQVIFDATVDEGFHDEVEGKRVWVAGKELWRDKRAWAQVGESTGRRIIEPVDFVYRVLLPEEKARFFQIVGNLSRVMRGREVRRALNA